MTSKSATPAPGLGPSPPTPRTPAAMLQALNETLKITHLIYHHNKNQHRAAKWWKWLAMLKRTVTRVVDELERLRGEYGEEEDDDEIDDEDEDEDEDEGGSDGWKRDAALVRLVQYLRARVVPRAYAAFSNVVADKQFSATGVVLIGILARVVGVVGVVPDDHDHHHHHHRDDEQQLGRETAEGAASRLEAQGIPIRRSSSSLTLSPSTAKKQEDGEDMGQVVSRRTQTTVTTSTTATKEASPTVQDEITATGASAIEDQGVTTTDVSIASPSSSPSLTSQKRAQEDIDDDDDEDDDISGEAEVRPSPPPPQPKKTKPSKRQKKDKDKESAASLSLKQTQTPKPKHTEKPQQRQRQEQKQKQSKKKQEQKGDAIDDIFGF